MWRILDSMCLARATLIIRASTSELTRYERVFSGSQSQQLHQPGHVWTRFHNIDHHVNVRVLLHRDACREQVLLCTGWSVEPILNTCLGCCIQPATFSQLVATVKGRAASQQRFFPNPQSQCGLNEHSVRCGIQFRVLGRHEAWDSGRE